MVPLTFGFKKLSHSPSKSIQLTFIELTILQSFFLSVLQRKFSDKLGPFVHPIFSIKQNDPENTEARFLITFTTQPLQIGMVIDLVLIFKRFYHLTSSTSI